MQMLLLLWVTSRQQQVQQMPAAVDGCSLQAMDLLLLEPAGVGGLQPQMMS
jgi:hypothetical protein